MPTPTSHIIDANGLSLHYIHYPNKEKPPIVMLHGLTANAYNFCGLVKAGLYQHFDIYALDLRGRGLSGKPAFGYDMRHHAQDVRALIDHLQLPTVSLLGHSFGAFLSVYMAVHHKERINDLCLLDIAIQMNPKSAEMLSNSLSRLDHEFNSWEEYIDRIRSAPYLAQWHEDMESYYRADVATNENGKVEPRANLANIVQAIKGLSAEDWKILFPLVSQRTLMLYAQGVYALDMPLVDEQQVKETASLMPHAIAREVDGNHATMLYAKGAKEIISAIVAFME